MNTTVIINRRELEYSVSGLMHPQYPAPDIKHLVDRLHTKDALRLEDLELTGPIELFPGCYMASCLVLLGVGASTLLYSNALQKKALEQKTTDYDTLKAQYDSTAKYLATAQNALTESKGKLWDALKLWNAAQASANNYMGESRRLTDDMSSSFSRGFPSSSCPLPP